MMEMQDTINGLRREISNIGVETRSPSTTQLQPVGSPIMFTRLDSERNAKVMKKAVMSKKMETKKYQVCNEFGEFNCQLWMTTWAYLGYCVILRTLPQDISLKERVEMSCWTSLA
jgi:hypothetical protein